MKLDFKIKQQPDNECLPTAISAVLDFHGFENNIDDIISDISSNSSKLHDWFFRGGIWTVKRGFNVKIRTMVSYIFDPSWSKISQEELKDKLLQEANYFKLWQENIKTQPLQDGVIFDNHYWSQIYLDAAEFANKFLSAGGKIELEPFSRAFIRENLKLGNPIIFSHNPTLLHGMQRAYNFEADDIRGFSWGHVAVIIGYDDNKNTYCIADPEGEFYEGKSEYEIDQDRVVESILRYNGDILIIGREQLIMESKIDNR